jgi:hypothetical protein
MRYICLKSLCYIIYKMDPLLNQYLVFANENLVEGWGMRHCMCMYSLRKFNKEYRRLFNSHNDVMVECALDGVSCDKEYEEVMARLPKTDITYAFSKTVTILKYTDEDIHYVITGDNTYHKVKTKDLKKMAITEAEYLANKEYYDNL